MNASLVRYGLRVVLLFGVLAGCGEAEDGPRATDIMHGDSAQHDATHEARQAEVAERGAAVMPFDLEQTVHVFKDLPDGGIQQVLAKDSANQEQIELIREHLQEEAQRFERGDFSDPARIHGPAMPGLTVLAQNADRLGIRYETLPDGGEIRYSTEDPAVLRALHAWFQAQRSDHGQHARGG